MTDGRSVDQLCWVVGATMPTLLHLTDLHLDVWPENRAAVERELERLGPVDDSQPLLLLLGGDHGGEPALRQIVALVRRYFPAAQIGWIRGNHDLWGRPYTDLWQPSPDLPATYLELANLDSTACTVVGSYGHYDFSGAPAGVSPEELETDAGQHDASQGDRSIDRLGKSHREIASEIADRFAQRYAAAVARSLPIVVLSHTWPFAPLDESLRSLACAYCCNQLLGDVILSHAKRPVVLLCGHTHATARWDAFGFPMLSTGSGRAQVQIARWEIPT